MTEDQKRSTERVEGRGRSRWIVGTAPTAARSERPQFFARTALVMAVIAAVLVVDEG